MSVAMDRVIAARTRLVLSEAFFGVLALNLRLKEDPTCPTGWVDGKTLGFNPHWVMKQTEDTLIAFVCHEVLHCSNGHPWRRDSRQRFRWNVATDCSINDLLRKSGFKTGKDWFYAEGDQVGMSAEWIYARLPEQFEDQLSQAVADALSSGEVRDAPTPGEGEDKDQDGQDGEGQGHTPTESDWQQAVKQAAQAAKLQGSLPAHLDRFAQETGKAKVDWKSVLRRFLTDFAKGDYTWTKPNSRYVSRRLYLPKLESHEMPGVAIAVDTSGSIDDVALASAKAEVEAVMEECKPAFVVTLYADAAVAGMDRFERGDCLEWRPKGGGGTDFRPVFKAVSEMDEQPACLIYLTDCLGTFPENSEIPVLWVTDHSSAQVPFGELIQMFP